MFHAEKERKVFSVIANRIGVKFTFFGEPIEIEEVFSTDGLLPLIYFSATKIAKDLMPNVDIGCRLESSDKALLGVVASNAGENGAAIRLMFCFEALSRAMKTKSDDLTMQVDTFDLGDLFNELSDEIQSSITQSQEYKQ